MENKDMELKGIKAAKLYLQRRGMEVLTDEPFECEAGAIEIIAKDEDRDELVFVEVKTRTDAHKGFPSESVTARKRAKFERIALAYLADCEVVDIPIRFDVISIIVLDNDRAMIRHHINA